MTAQLEYTTTADSYDRRAMRRELPTGVIAEPAKPPAPKVPAGEGWQLVDTSSCVWEHMMFLHWTWARGVRRQCPKCESIATRNGECLACMEKIT